jgi:pimeloyl-ACP methyl ester carboxylesterase
MTQTYILVHGAWHGAWCWYKLIPSLEQAGHNAIALDLPAHGKDTTSAKGLTLQHYVERVIQAVDGQREPVVLVGHSLAGLTIPGVAEQRPDKIKALVYLDALLLRNGESYPEVAARNQPALCAVLASSVSVSPDGTTSSVNLDKAKEIFYADCSDEDVERAKTLLGPEPLGPRGEPVRITDHRFGRVPRVYIDCLQGNVFTPSFKKTMYTAMPCRKVYTMNTSHSPFLSAPAELARVLREV